MDVRGLSRTERKAAQRARILRGEEARVRARRVAQILKKPVDARSLEEALLLTECTELVKEWERRSKKQEKFKRRQEEVYDEPEQLQKKVCELAGVIRNARHLVIYTGAGISTAASIPDYRGPNGVWTLLQKGQSVSASDLSAAEPTLTHMCIARLHDHNLSLTYDVRENVVPFNISLSHINLVISQIIESIVLPCNSENASIDRALSNVQHVVSQNCDGLHLRSGFPRSAISELHGNMYIEVCTRCTPNREYIRLFDVTEHTALHRHQTGRTCHKCDGHLRDTIVHFGERGTLAQPLNWEAAAEAAKATEVILCLGSSLKVLKKYPCLWCMNRPSCRRPKLYIVNLQWTPKDDLAALKIHGKCDDVMKLLLGELGLDIPKYDRAKDPIFSLAVHLRPEEETTRTRKLLSLPSSVQKLVAETEATKEPLSPEHAQLTGGWFGRGCTKGIKRKKLV